MILVCYDGSPDAQTAIDYAAQLMPSAKATVLTVWRPFSDASSYSGSTVIGVGMGAYADHPAIDAASEQSASEKAADGAQRAATAGLVAEPRVAGSLGGVARTILDVAADVNADAVVLGTRGRSGVKSFLLGSVSHEVVQHADRPVLIVPSSRLSEQRRGWACHADATLDAA